MKISEKNSNGLVIVLAVINVVLLGLVVLFATDTISFNDDVDKNNQANETSNVNDDSSNSTNNEVSFPVENGYHEISLTNDEKVSINKELYKHFQPGNGNDPIIKINSTYKKNIDVLADDCMKLGFVKWYITFNNKAGYTYEKVPAPEHGDNFVKIKYSRLEEITKEMFNSESLTCDTNNLSEEMNVKYGGLVQDSDGYILLAMAGGGFVPISVKTLAKYTNDTDYYLVVHMYLTPEDELKLEGNTLGNWEDVLTTWEDDSNVTTYSRYIKIKYDIANNKKYLIGLEYLD